MIEAENAGADAQSVFENQPAKSAVAVTHARMNSSESLQARGDHDTKDVEEKSPKT